MSKLVLLRHGQSLANKVNEYTGWSDSPLTDYGVKQAHVAGELLRSQQLEFADLHTSVLVRAIKTANIVLDELHQSYIPIHKTWRLNERHYGSLRGWNKDDTRKIFGAQQVALWRRSYYAVPPKLDFPVLDRRYADLPESSLPLAESLEMASARIVPYWTDTIAPQLIDGKNQLVVAHGSTLRAMIKFIEKISDEDIDGVEVANGEPIIYTFDEKMNLTDKTIVTD
ncbi:2,3-bisphosphoglycerate-dependent phosphoglycerate mutase [Ligilactobacillus pobuzihii]|uniref:2,3-bisphosphoglycerate-dependent phosphoglycerate mutase n=1 Tax=Ligilactobacillus pobuzihii TaxID=449659 RepID=UPI0019D024A6|nr:2,3-bisphosphoglycerate-dependent phosphoglycerate mutase [Ligilactobacillus pobuzihii]MBN7274105.1 2,3-bisphosphoglycerate-dependent phosphoglycerate mutase [Ligilactobacillus pobuzihii]HIZ95494.1 2,3-bisphosphoglycerate-dependent phosphoglycerate mutase [Candidatus Ligilactobacillus excrementavium]